MFSRNQTQVRKSQPSLRARLMRGIIIVIMVVSAIVGVLLFFVIRGDARSQLSYAQRDVLNGYGQEIVSRIEAARDDVAQIARSEAVKNFARETQAINSTRIESTQNQLLTAFLELLEHNAGDYVAARYVTRNGSVWTEVTDYDVTQT